MSDEGSIRIGDTEREEAVRRLGEHYEAGRLSADEHGERVEGALRARTGDELAAIFADLPGEPAAGAEHAAWSGAGGPGAGGPASARPDGRGPDGRGPGGRGRGGRPAWTRRGPLGKVPLPLLIAVGAVLLMASIGCAVGGGHAHQHAWGGGHPHPPVLLIAAIVAGVVIYRKRRAA
jgi:hypothetical protein